MGGIMTVSDRLRIPAKTVSFYVFPVQEIFVWSFIFAGIDGEVFVTCSYNAIFLMVRGFDFCQRRITYWRLFNTS